jgi:hypothetical protein
MKFTRSLTEVFGTLETFPIVNEEFRLQIRRVLLRGFPKALLYVALDDRQEVRIIRCFDTRSQEAQPRQT